MGKNEEAARYSGIRTHHVIISAPVICAGLTAISAVFLAMVHPLDLPLLPRLVL